VAVLVTPSSALGELDIAPMVGYLETLGFRVRQAEHLWAQNGFLAGTDAGRAADLQAAFDDPDVDMVLCARGGYGCARLLPLLDLDRLAASPKVFAGFSDITTLHLALNRRGLATLHAPMAGHVGKWEAAWVEDAYRRALVDGDLSLPEGAPRGQGVVPGRVEAVVTGGCLSLLGDSQGTPEAFDGRGKIVLLEDIGEQAYRVDARLTHLINSGSLAGVAGIVVGEMTGTDEKPDDPSKRVPWREVIRERLGGLGVPLITDYPFGHITNPLTLPLGLSAVLDAEAGTLTYTESLYAQ